MTKDDLKSIRLPLSREDYLALRDSHIPVRLWPKRLIVDYVRAQDEEMQRLVEASTTAGYGDL
ncbi:MAG: hypothetical protein J6N71_10870 [Muribaculaceae bacterium]|nr:hypothetical protein [Muribaculaceae bacterium]